MSYRLGVRKLLLLYIYLVGTLSLINITLFLYHRGAERIFGPAWLAFENYSMTALPMALAFLIWSRTRAERLRFAAIIVLIALAVVASGSRGTLVAIALALPVLIWLAYRKITRDQMWEARHSINQVMLVAVIIGVTLAAFSSSLLVGFVGRVEELVASLVNPQGTIALRIVLWTAAFKAWLTSPIVGIGIGNFNLVDQVVPEMKTAPVWYYIRGMSAHNVVLHYLAETGIIGVVALLAVTASGLRMGREVFRRKLSLEETQISGAIMIAMVVFALSIFFMRAWTWAQEGYIMAMLFGMAAAWCHQLESRQPE
jgi:O-antigen ligase